MLNSSLFRFRKAYFKNFQTIPKSINMYLNFYQNNQNTLKEKHFDPSGDKNMCPT